MNDFSKIVEAKNGNYLAVAWNSCSDGWNWDTYDRHKVHMDIGFLEETDADGCPCCPKNMEMALKNAVKQILKELRWKDSGTRDIGYEAFLADADEIAEDIQFGLPEKFGLKPDDVDTVRARLLVSDATHLDEHHGTLKEMYLMMREDFMDKDGPALGLEGSVFSVDGCKKIFTDGSRTECQIWAIRLDERDEAQERVAQEAALFFASRWHLSSSTLRPVEELSGMWSSCNGPYDPVLIQAWAHEYASRYKSMRKAVEFFVDKCNHMCLEAFVNEALKLSLREDEGHIHLYYQQAPFEDGPDDDIDIVANDSGGYRIRRMHVLSSDGTSVPTGPYLDSDWNGLISYLWALCKKGSPNLYYATFSTVQGPVMPELHELRSYDPRDFE